MGGSKYVLLDRQDIKKKVKYEKNKEEKNKFKR